MSPNQSSCPSVTGQQTTPRPRLGPHLLEECRARQAEAGGNRDWCHLDAAGQQPARFGASSSRVPLTLFVFSSSARPYKTPRLLTPMALATRIFRRHAASAGILIRSLPAKSAYAPVPLYKSTHLLLPQGLAICIFRHSPMHARLRGVAARRINLLTYDPVEAEQPGTFTLSARSWARGRSSVPQPNVSHFRSSSQSTSSDGRRWMSCDDIRGNAVSCSTPGAGRSPEH